MRFGFNNVLPQFEMYKINGTNMDVLCLKLILFVQLTCIQHHHLPKPHPFLDISLHNNSLYFLIQLKVPANQHKQLTNSNHIINKSIHTFPKLPFPNTVKK